jgi:hypothetical protein
LTAHFCVGDSVGRVNGENTSREFESTDRSQCRGGVIGSDLHQSKTKSEVRGIVRVNVKKNLYGFFCSSEVPFLRNEKASESVVSRQFNRITVNHFL